MLSMDNNENRQKKNKNFWNLMPAKSIKNSLDRTNNKWTSVSEDKNQKIGTGDDREEKIIAGIRNN